MLARLLVGTVLLVTGCSSAGQGTAPSSAPIPSSTTIDDGAANDETCSQVGRAMREFGRVLVTPEDWMALAEALLDLVPYASEEIDPHLRTAAENARTAAALIEQVEAGRLTPAELEEQGRLLAEEGTTDRVTRWMMSTCPEIVGTVTAGG